MENTASSRSFSELKAQKYGPTGSPKNIEFQANAKAFRVGQVLKQIRLRQQLTQEQLAHRIGTQKSYISKIENGSDMNLSTLFRICDHGLETPARILFGEIIE